MFEQAIRFLAEWMRHTGQAVIDTLDARRPNMDEPLADGLDSVYTGPLEDGLDRLRLYIESGCVADAVWAGDDE